MKMHPGGGAAQVKERQREPHEQNLTDARHLEERKEANQAEGKLGAGRTGWVERGAQGKPGAWSLEPGVWIVMLDLKGILVVFRKEESWDSRI